MELNIKEKLCEGCDILIDIKCFKKHLDICEEILITCKKCNFYEKRKNFSHSCFAFQHLHEKIKFDGF